MAGRCSALNTNVLLRTAPPHCATCGSPASPGQPVLTAPVNHPLLGRPFHSPLMTFFSFSLAEP